MDRERILITAALPYANGPIHFGHLAGAYLPADCYARAMRLFNRDVLFICGSDEYGVAIELQAEINKRTPKEHVDIFHEQNRALFERMNISFDHYSRTTWEKHKEAVYEIFFDLWNNGYIEEKITVQLYSEKDKRFLADRYIEGTCPRCGFDEARGDECTKCAASYEATDLKNPRSKLTKAPLVLKETKHLFLKLDLFKERLETWLQEKKWKSNVLNFVKGYIHELKPRAITRDTSWGIPVPLQGFEGKVLYVWFDAPIGYISASRDWAEKKGTPDAWRAFWCEAQTKLVQFIGKDNIFFHAIIFPAMIMGQNMPYKLVNELPANEFLNLEGKQLSKSDGWYIDLATFLERYTEDQLRYFLAANAPETADSEFNWKEFQLKCNADLVGKFGNFVHRSCIFIKNNCENRVPKRTNLDEEDTAFLKKMSTIQTQIEDAYKSFRLREVIRLLMELVQEGNGYFDYRKPWADAKESIKKARMENTLSICLQCVQTLAVLAYPIIPNTAKKILSQLQISTETITWQLIDKSLVEGTMLGESTVLFRKIEDEEIEQEIKALHAQAKAQEKKKKQIATIKEQISIDDVRKLDLRVAKIVAAEPVPKSKKLLKLNVDVGSEVRQVVAGIAEDFKVEDIINQHVVFVANLAPAKLMGIESQGMILVAQGQEKRTLLLCPDIEPGSTVS